MSAADAWNAISGRRGTGSSRPARSRCGRPSPNATRQGRTRRTAAGAYALSPIRTGRRRARRAGNGRPARAVRTRRTTRVADAWYPSADGTGTTGLRRTNPTAFSTLPFSLPEYGLQNLASNPYCAQNRWNITVLTVPSALRWPTPVALPGHHHARRHPDTSEHLAQPVAHAPRRLARQRRDIPHVRIRVRDHQEMHHTLHARDRRARLTEIHLRGPRRPREPRVPLRLRTMPLPPPLDPPPLRRIRTFEPVARVTAATPAWQYAAACTGARDRRPTTPRRIPAYPESINVRPAPPAGRGEKPSLEAYLRHRRAGTHAAHARSARGSCPAPPTA